MQIPIPTLRLLIACQKEADTCRILWELEKIKVAEVQSVSDMESFPPAFKACRPDVIVTDDSSAFSVLKSFREAHSNIHFIIIGETEPFANTQGKGVNIYLAKQELSRLGPWVETFHAMKLRGTNQESPAATLEKIRKATGKLGEKIYSPTLDDLQVDARRFAKTPEQREAALKTWTKEIEQKKLESSLRLTTQPNWRPDPLLPAVDSKEQNAGSFPVPSIPVAEPFLHELRKMQLEMTSQLARLSAELKELQQQNKEERR